MKVLRRFSRDKKLSAAVKKNFADTMKMDAEFRKLREQAAHMSRMAHAIAPPSAARLAAGAAAPPPTVAVYDSNNTQTLPGAEISDPEGSSDPTAPNVFDQTTKVAQFYSQVFNRNSVDGMGMTLLSSIHYGVKYNNAFWNGMQMTYGDGDGAIFMDFSRGNDVIGHELTHGVTQHSLQLIYANQPGGLNESISDCFGSMFRQWSANQNVNDADWLIGSDIMGPTARQRGFTCLRDMSDPAASHCLSPQPTNFSQYQDGMDPHESSGIPNLAFYTTATAIGGNSWEKAGQIWYNALTGSGPNPNMKMKAFANSTRALAAQLYPDDTSVAGAVNAGWKAVGL
jgi:Zn-dependent metalloprotease